MGCFQVRYDSRVVIYERKLFIRLATGKQGCPNCVNNTCHLGTLNLEITGVGLFYKI